MSGAGDDNANSGFPDLDALFSDGDFKQDSKADELAQIDLDQVQNECFTQLTYLHELQGLFRKDMVSCTNARIFMLWNKFDSNDKNINSIIVIMDIVESEL